MEVRQGFKHETRPAIRQRHKDLKRMRIVPRSKSHRRCSRCVCRHEVPSSQALSSCGCRQDAQLETRGTRRLAAVKTSLRSRPLECRHAVVNHAGHMTWTARPICDESTEAGCRVLRDVYAVKCEVRSKDSGWIKTCSLVRRQLVRALGRLPRTTPHVSQKARWTSNTRWSLACPPSTINITTNVLPHPERTYRDRRADANSMMSMSP